MLVFTVVCTVGSVIYGLVMRKALLVQRVLINAVAILTSLQEGPEAKYT